ncbi:MAG TPA: glycoside hydrolase family 28 protein [Prolixibacteraceae bacterium]|nr:glycoside hydrolase family 28 protein [Prolixibacteraceae bacterium]
MRKATNKFSGGYLSGLLLALAACITSVNMGYSQKSIPEAVYKDIPFTMGKVNLPAFATNEFNIRDYGAVADGVTLNTEAFIKAIKDLTARGGGKLVVPSGIWLTGPILFQSNINLHLEKGALIIFSENFDLYPLIETSYSGVTMMHCISPIYGKNLQNIAITGEGIIDGSGHAWRFLKKGKLTEGQWKELIASGGVLDEKKTTWYPSESALLGSKMEIDQGYTSAKTLQENMAIKDFLRPVMISFTGCRNVWLDGVTFQNSPAWNIHLLQCEDITVNNITVRNPWYAQNGDGIDIESCKNMVLYNSSFDVGDDAICIKSGKNEEGRKRGVPTENLLVKKCTVYHGHGGFTIGSEMSGGVRNIHVSECTFIGTDVGLRFKSTRGRGGIVEKIWISDINMINIPGEALLFDLFYGGKAPLETDSETDKLPAGLPKADETTPLFRQIDIRNIHCKGAGKAFLFNGLPEMNIRDIFMKDIFITSTKGGEIFESDGVKMVNVLITSKIGQPIVVGRSKNILLNGKAL